jgi:hypothetical protein
MGDVEITEVRRLLDAAISAYERERESTREALASLRPSKEMEGRFHRWKARLDEVGK